VFLYPAVNRFLKVHSPPNPNFFYLQCRAHALQVYFAINVSLNGCIPRSYLTSVSGHISRGVYSCLLLLLVSLHSAYLPPFSFSFPARYTLLSSRPLGISTNTDARPDTLHVTHPSSVVDATPPFPCTPPSLSTSTFFHLARSPRTRALETPSSRKN
jgi:hypothetical protein